MAKRPQYLQLPCRHGRGLLTAFQQLCNRDRSFTMGWIAAGIAATITKNFDRKSFRYCRIMKELKYDVSRSKTRTKLELRTHWPIKHKESTNVCRFCMRRYLSSTAFSLPIRAALVRSWPPPTYECSCPPTQSIKQLTENRKNSWCRSRSLLALCWEPSLLDL